jgi:uncharacterized membrane protein YebE (DUF533 family)
MFDTKKLLDQLVGSGLAGGFAGGLAGGTLANALSSKKARKMAGSALKVGGLALVGGVAYKAWQAHQQRAAVGATAVADAPPTAFIPAQQDIQQTQSLSLLLARAMIAAAKADGQIDAQESQTILNQINSLELPSDAKAFLFEEYSRPLDIVGLAADVDTPEHAAEVYVAALLMVDPPSPPEQMFLDSLAGALQLDGDLVRDLRAGVLEGQSAA